MRDVVVIGAGIAGLSAAVKLRQAGREVDLVTMGLGGIQLGTGTVDLLGYNPERVVDPVAAIDEIKDQGHPYAHFSGKAVADAAQWLQDTLGEDLLVNNDGKNFLLPTAVGSLRPTWLAQPSMVAGHFSGGERVVIVGLRRLKDFYPQLVAENLAKADFPGGKLQVRHAWIDLPVRGCEVVSSGLNHARATDDVEFRDSFIASLKQVIQPGEIIGLPAVLGVKDRFAWRDLADRVGAKIFEIPLQPPSIPGMRINQALTDLAKSLGIRYIIGSQVTGGESEGDKMRAIAFNSAGSQTRIEAQHFIYAGGGFESGTLTMDSYGKVYERVFDLPLAIPEGQLLHEKYWGADQPLFKVGGSVDDSMRVLNSSGKPVYSNLYAVGGIIGGSIRWREKNGEGVALASVMAACDAILGGAR